MAPQDSLELDLDRVAGPPDCGLAAHAVRLELTSELIRLGRKGVAFWTSEFSAENEIETEAQL